MVRSSLVLFLALPTVAQSATLVVGTAQAYTTIQDAIDAAANGDTIEVEADSYNENIAVSIDLEIIGLGGSANTILDGGGAVMVAIDGATVTMTGFTLDSTAQRGMEVTNGAVVTGDDLVMTGFNLFGGFEGAAMAVMDSDVTFSNSVFDDNYADDQGGAIAIHDSVASFADCDFNGNGSDEDGGAMGLYNSVATIDTCTFEANGSNDDGGALDIDDGSDVSIINSIFSNNVGDDAGGAITAEDGGSLTVDNCVFLTNDTPAGGGGIRVRRDLDLTVIGGIFQGNTSPGNGGAITAGDGDHSVDGTVFLSNESDALGGAINMAGNCNMTIANADFSSNVATLGGALYVRDDSVLGISDSSFDANIAGAGRGGAIRWFPSSGTLNIISSSFTNNVATSTGGAISSASATYGDTGTFNLVNNTFIANSADDQGGGVYAQRADSLAVIGNTFCGNDAVSNGGGMAVVFGAPTNNQFENNVIADNVSGGNGGGLRFEGSSDPDLTNNTFLGNDAADGGHIRLAQASGNLTNNIFAFAAGGDGVSQDSTNGSRDFNLWFTNTASDTGGALGPGDLGGSAVFADPDLTDYSGDCFNDDYGLEPGSPAIDAGDPAIQDADGTNSDVGAFGGPNSPVDDDGDGYLAFVDCDDTDAAVNPGADEICDGIDNDCDGDIDGPQASDASDWYPDLDGDGFGDDDGRVRECSPPTGYVAVPGDCDDAEPAVFDGAYEACDGLDNDCDGDVDEGQPMTDYYADRDGDGYGDPDTVTQACAAPSGWVENADDCDDFEPLAWTNATELCDLIDNDCDDEVDEGAETTWYEDGDGDGYGADGANTFDSCEGADGFTDDNTDCDDSEPTVNPGEEEICDELDNDCDGDINEDLVVTWYEDNDEDAFGNDETTTEDCEEPSGFTAEGGDCDDSDPFINPDMEDDSDDGIDQDCDGETGPKFSSEKVKGTPDCGCDASSTGGSTGWLALLGVLLLRRRR